MKERNHGFPLISALINSLLTWFSSYLSYKLHFFYISTKKYFPPYIIKSPRNPDGSHPLFKNRNIITINGWNCNYSNFVLFLDFEFWEANANCKFIMCIWSLSDWNSSQDSTKIFKYFVAVVLMQHNLHDFPKCVLWLLYKNCGLFLHEDVISNISFRWWVRLPVVYLWI